MTCVCYNITLLLTYLKIKLCWCYTQTTFLFAENELDLQCMISKLEFYSWSQSSQWMFQRENGWLRVTKNMNWQLKYNVFLRSVIILGKINTCNYLGIFFPPQLKIFRLVMLTLVLKKKNWKRSNICSRAEIQFLF